MIELISVQIFFCLSHFNSQLTFRFLFYLFAEHKNQNSYPKLNVPIPSPPKKVKSRTSHLCNIRPINLELFWSKLFVLVFFCSNFLVMLMLHQSGMLNFTPPCKMSTQHSGPKRACQGSIKKYSEPIDLLKVKPVQVLPTPRKLL